MINNIKKKTKILADFEKFIEYVNSNKVKVTKTKEFIYIFVYGTEWKFNIKTEKFIEEENLDALIIDSKGESPEQYSF